MTPPAMLLSTNATPLFDAAGKIDGMVVTVEDITERLAWRRSCASRKKWNRSASWPPAWRMISTTF